MNLKFIMFLLEYIKRIIKWKRISFFRWKMLMKHENLMKFSIFLPWCAACHLPLFLCLVSCSSKLCIFILCPNTHDEMTHPSQNLSITIVVRHLSKKLGNSLACTTTPPNMIHPKPNRSLSIHTDMATLALQTRQPLYLALFDVKSYVPP